MPVGNDPQLYFLVGGIVSRVAQKAEIQQRRWQARSGRERRPAPLGRRPGGAIGSPVCLRCYAHIIYWGVGCSPRGAPRRSTPNVSMQTALARRLPAAYLVFVCCAGSKTLVNQMLHFLVLLTKTKTGLLHLVRPLYSL